MIYAPSALISRCYCSPLSVESAFQTQILSRMIEECRDKGIQALREEIDRTIQEFPSSDWGISMPNMRIFEVALTISSVV